MKFIEVGRIVGTHGIRGEVKVISETSFKDERYKVGNILYVKYEGQMQKIQVNTYRPHKNFDLITFNNLSNINDVLKYVNCDIFVNKDDLQELEEDEFYYEDLIGMKVVDEEGNMLGEVTDITEVPQGEILVLEKNDKTKAMIPFVNEFIKDIDLEKGLIKVALIEGLI